MTTRMSTVVAGLLAIGLIIGSLWAWAAAPNLAVNSHKPDIAGLAWRSGAVAAFAAAQVLIFSYVVGAFYRRDLVSDLLKLAAILVATVALISALALGLAGK